MEIFLKIIRTVLAIILSLLLWPGALFACVFVSIFIFTFDEWDKIDTEIIKVISILPVSAVRRVWGK